MPARSFVSSCVALTRIVFLVMPTYSGHPNFELVRGDVVESLLIEVDQVRVPLCLSLLAPSRSPPPSSLPLADSSIITLSAGSDDRFGSPNALSQIYHLACPASPKAYQLNAVKTLKTSFTGTQNMLGLAKRTKARFLLSSTSGASPFASSL